jgi:hypothetical protein
MGVHLDQASSGTRRAQGSLPPLLVKLRERSTHHSSHYFWE